ncbi:UNVERIFIED_CONTAM: hypothetical protein GTU68_025762, partial [Idotea baltica]|nr:hypothetical protein [Idotea baltica]
MEGGLLSLKWNNHRSSFIHVLSSLRKKDSFCDVTIACEGKFYPSHKLVLSTCSEYFQDMFQHTQCKHPVIVLKDIHCEDLEALLNYMYLGEVNVLQEKLSTLIKAAECLKIKGLAVPDDPPKDAIGEKRSSGLDSAPDSKRRRTETSKPFSKNLSKSTEHSYRPNTTSQDNNYSLNRSSDNEMPENYSFDNENSSTPIKNKGRESNFIKQEPPDTYPEVEDTKEGVLQSAHNSFMSPLPQDEASNTDVMGPSESQVCAENAKCC